MNKQEKPSPVVITWWKLITALVMFAVAVTIVIMVYNSYMKAMGI